jgi:hypothetical protein
MRDRHNLCKLCGLRFDLSKSLSANLCRKCRDEVESIFHFKNNLVPVNKETIFNNLDGFIASPIEIEAYLDLNYSIEQYERFKLRSKRIKKKLKLA